jgi:hypothetical protein
MPMTTYLERATLIGVGIFVGLALGRTPFEAAAIPVYVVAVSLIIAARWAVDRWRGRRPQQA